MLVFKLNVKYDIPHIFPLRNSLLKEPFCKGLRFYELVFISVSADKLSIFN